MAVLLNLDNPRANRFGPRVRVIGRFNFGLDLGSFRFTLLDEFDWLRLHLFASGESRPGNVGWIDGKLAQAVIIARPAARGRGDSRKRNPSYHSAIVITVRVGLAGISTTSKVRICLCPVMQYLRETFSIALPIAAAPAKTLIPLRVNSLRRLAVRRCKRKADLALLLAKE